MAKKKKKLPKDSFDDDKLRAFVEENFGYIGEAYMPLGFSAAFVGVCTMERENPVLVYDANKIVNMLMKRDEMTEEEAIEFFEYNIAGFKTGNGTHPMFIHYIQPSVWQDD